MPRLFRDRGAACFASVQTGFGAAGTKRRSCTAADTHILLLFGLTVFLLAIAFSSIFTWIAMLCPNRTIAAVICILLAFACLLTGAIRNAMLDAPKTHPTYTWDESNHPVVSEMPNPQYLEGTKREIFQTLYDMNPGGQSIQCASMEAIHIQRLPIYSLIIVLATTGVGILFFQRKDLK